MTSKDFALRKSSRDSDNVRSPLASPILGVVTNRSSGDSPISRERKWKIGYELAVFVHCCPQRPTNLLCRSGWKGHKHAWVRDEPDSLEQRCEGSTILGQRNDRNLTRVHPSTDLRCFTARVFTLAVERVNFISHFDGKYVAKAEITFPSSRCRNIGSRGWIVT